MLPVIYLPLFCGSIYSRSTLRKKRYAEDVPGSDPIVIHITLPGSDPIVIHITLPGSDPIVIHITLPGSDPIVIHITLPGSDPIVIHITLQIVLSSLKEQLS